MSLATKCMIITLNIGFWEGRKLDKLASKDLTASKGAIEGSARVIKETVPHEAFKNVITARNAIKAHVETYTLPWKKGEYILMRNLYAFFMEKYGELEKNFNDAVHEFVDVIYPPARERAAFNLSELFNPDDYPHESEIKPKFYVRLGIEPLPEAGDFRVELDQAHIDRIKADMEETINGRLVTAMTDVYERIMKVLQHYADTMAQGDKTFRDSTVTNLTDIVDILPGLNVTGDPRLKAIRKRLAGHLYQVEPETLRDDGDARAKAAAEAQEILDEMRGFFKAT